MGNMRERRSATEAAHAARTPLSVILSAAELLERYGDQRPREWVNERLKQIQAAAEEVGVILDSMAESATDAKVGKE
jgi:signal transduction histidine kinase